MDGLRNELSETELRSFSHSQTLDPNRALAMRPMAGLKRSAKVPAAAMTR